jgi:hypothetical protein
MINKEFKILDLKNRIHKLANAGDKNTKSPGVLKKLKRQLRNLTKDKD